MTEPLFVPPPEVDDLVRVLQLRVQWDSSPFGFGENAWNFVMLKTALVDQQQGLWDLWEAAVKPRWVGRRPTGWQFVQALVVDKWPAELPDLQIDVNEFAPDDAGDGAPPQLSPLIKWDSNYPGRSYRGRTFWGHIKLADLANSSIGDDLFTHINEFVAAMLDTFGAGPIIGVDPKLIVFSKQHNKIPEPKGRYAPVTAGEQRFNIATLRGRRISH